MGKKTRRVVVEEGDSSDEEVVPKGMEVQIDFEAQTPGAEDYDSIKVILNHAFAKTQADLGALSDEIIARSGISQCLKQSLDAVDEADDDEEDEDEDEDPVFGICSLMSLSDAKRGKAVDQVRNYIIARSQDSAEPSTAAKFQNYLETARVGWLLNERPSLPPTIAAPVFETFLKDLEVLKNKDETYKFDYYLMVCQVHQLAAGSNEDAEFWANAEELYFAKGIRFVNSELLRCEVKSLRAEAMAYRARQEDEAVVRNNLETLKIDGRVPCTPARGLARGLLTDVNSTKKFRQMGLSMSTSKVSEFKSAMKPVGQFRAVFEAKSQLKIVPRNSILEHVPEIKHQPDFYEDMLGPENVINPRLMDKFSSWMTNHRVHFDPFEDMDFSLPELPPVEDTRASTDFGEFDLAVPEPSSDEDGYDSFAF